MPRRDLIGKTIGEHRGRIAKVMPRGFYAVFEEVVDAVAASVQLQRASAGGPDGLRCGIHSGHCEQRGNSYYGVAVNRAAHILDAAHPGQTLASQAEIGRASCRERRGIWRADGACRK